LIKDLLDFSRIGIKANREQVDCKIILQEVLEDLGAAIKEAQVEIITGSLPVVSGYPTELKQLFQNLIINAIKFRKKDTAHRVSVSVQTCPESWQFSVKDNGIGIDKKHSEKIFVIFQRLHSRTEYEGSGIGLAHCKKIVELHDGKLWVESTPGEGTAFHFTIPYNIRRNEKTRA
jgi:light-regulated signal transduction histidine kinase (bacteriophytochrome)